MDKFFTQKLCDLCHKPLTGGRIMSMFNRDCICMECKRKETHDTDYDKAVKADHEEILKGNYNFKGIKG